ncbi:MAG: phosphoglycerate kinase [Lachnospiraceae bacterium]|jgi:phosphoglycerate kinase|nr:phosphoglycerate kinase [Lachnospiraceae bacterium]
MSLLNKKSVDDINVRGKRVLCRCDFNVPLIDGRITDENRLVAAIPTIKKLINDGGRVILCSHMGKPKGQVVPSLSLAPVAKRLSELLGMEVKFVPEDTVVGDKVRTAVSEMKDGDVILLENTRFRPEETKNEVAFSKDLASICDIFVNDAFGTAHRAHCSNVGVASLVDTAVVGYLMQKEIDFLGNAVNSPVHPFVSILGGAKVADKLNVINTLLDKCDTLIIGGGMAYTFIKGQGYEIGKSLVDDTKIDYCMEMMEKAEKLGKKILLPIDAVVADDFPNPIDKPIDTQICDITAIPADKEALDIGPKTRELYAEAVRNAKTVVWNGPMGVSENPSLAEGTIAVAKAMADSDATTIIGGGDSAAAVNNLGFGDKMSHISTGGGASLEFLEGKYLPGVVAANDK